LATASHVEHFNPQRVFLAHEPGVEDIVRRGSGTRLIDDKEKGYNDVESKNR